MHSGKDCFAICFLVLNLMTFTWGVGPQDPVNLSFDMHANDEDSIGRISSLDRLLEEYIETITMENGDLTDAIKKASILVEEAEDKSIAQYYVELLELIQKEGSMAVLQDERERLVLIMESVGKGAELDHTVKQRNVIGAFADAEAKHIFNRLPDIGMRDFSNFEVPDLTSTKQKNVKEIKPDEPMGDTTEELRRRGSPENAKRAKSEPETPKSDQDKTAKQEIQSDEKEKPETPENVSNTDEDDSSVKEIAGETKNKLPDIPDGEGGEDVEDEIKSRKAGEKRPNIPPGTMRDEM